MANSNHHEAVCGRREFNKIALGSLALGSFSIASLTGCYQPPVKNTEAAKTIEIDLSLPENQILNTVGGALALPVNSIDAKGLLLYRASKTDVRVFSRRCTHFGCALEPFSAGVSACRCHHSEFDTSGQPIKGPAKKPLKTYPARVVGNKITISA